MRLDHPVNNPWEKLRLVAAELSMQQTQTFQFNGKPEVARRHQILNFEIFELDLETKIVFV